MIKEIVDYYRSKTELIHSTTDIQTASKTLA